MSNNSKIKSLYITEINNVIISYIDSTADIISKIADIRNSVRAELIEEKQAEYIQLLEAEKKKAYGNINTAFEAYCERLSKAFTVDSDKINNKDLKLLEGNTFLLSQNDIDILAEKHRDNYTMMLAVVQYARKNGLTVSFMSSEEKRTHAATIAEEAKIYIVNDNGYGVGDFCTEMAGNLFSYATYLNE